MDGLPGQTNNRVEIIHLNVATGVGREAAGQYGIRITPSTVLVDNQGQLLDRQSGRPDADRLINKMTLAEEPIT